MSTNPRGLPLRLLLGLVGVAIAFVILVGLGTWQVQRLAWKEALLATIRERTAAEPIGIKDALDRFEDVEYVPVALSGRFEHAYERHVFTTHDGQSGYNVYTPLVMANGEAVFVNRGFVPYDRKDPATRAEGQVEGIVEVTGLARAGLSEKPSWIVPDNDPAKNVFHWKDIRTMRETSGLPNDVPVLAVFVDANDAPNPGGLPLGGVTLIDLPNNHLQYALTWYGLAAVLLVVTAAFLWRRRRLGASGVDG
ncbi:MAG: SURF1 family protein [Rhizobiaceae bacterium]|nr:SURF1 family protein [Rhizobiaceae bacterium]